MASEAEPETEKGRGAGAGNFMGSRTLAREREALKRGLPIEITLIRIRVLYTEICSGGCIILAIG